MSAIEPSGGNGNGGWWGAQSATEQISPYIPPPPRGFVPPTPVPQGGNPPTFVQFVYDNGFIGYVLNT